MLFLSRLQVGGTPGCGFLRKSFPGVRLAVKDRQQYTAEPENRQSIWDEVRDDPALSGWRRSWTATIS
jgi:hypothetical protein